MLNAAMRRLAKYERVTGSWFELEDCARPVGEFRVHTVPIVLLGSGGESEVELAPRPTRGAVKYPKRRKAGSYDVSIRAEDDDSLIEDGFGERGPAAAIDVTKDPQEAALAGLADEVQPVLLPPPPLVPREDVAQGSVGTTVVSEETRPPVKQVPMPPSSHPSPRAEAPVLGGRRGKSTASMRANGGKLDFYEKKVGFFQATCGNVAHGKCALTRTARKLAGSSNAAPVGGRLLGFMSYRLMNSFVESREERCSAEVLRGVQLSDRDSARAELKRLPGWTELLACERAGRRRAGGQEVWWDKFGDKLNRERNDGESDHEEARISRNLFDLFEQTARTEEAMNTVGDRKERDQWNGDWRRNRASRTGTLW